MRNRVLVFSGAAIFVSLRLPHAFLAQCGVASEQFRNIAVETSKPFVAEFSTDFSPPWPAALRHAGLRYAARDSAGRLRLVLAAWKSTVKNQNHAAPDAERQMIFIGDRTTRTTITLDTADKSATVRAPRGNPPDALNPFLRLAESFCAGMIARRKRAPGTQSEGLGLQTISCYDAVGLRQG